MQLVDDARMLTFDELCLVAKHCHDDKNLLGGLIQIKQLEESLRLVSGSLVSAVYPVGGFHRTLAQFSIPDLKPLQELIRWIQSQHGSQRELRIFIAGGFAAYRNGHTDDYSDIDIFITGFHLYTKWMGREVIPGWNIPPTTINNYGPQFGIIANSQSKFQVICMKDLRTPVDIVDEFDLQICKTMICVEGSFTIAGCMPELTSHSDRHRDRQIKYGRRSLWSGKVVY